MIKYSLLLQHLTGLEIGCSVSYLDRIFDEIMDCYSPEKLDNTLKTTLNEYNPEVLLEKQNHEDLYELTEEDLKECGIFIERFNWPQTSQLPEQQETVTNQNLTLPKMSNIEFDEYFESFYKNILTFIQEYIPSVLHITYIKRLDRIKQMIKLISKKKKSDRNINILRNLIDKECIYFNNSLFEKYKPHLNLTKKVFDKFFSDLDKAIDGFFYFKFVKYETSDLNDHTERPFLLVQEYMEIYKYITKVPELLALGYVLVLNPSIKIIIIIHMLGLFLTRNEEIISESRIFILLFILKALSCTSKNRIDFIKVSNLQESILSEHPDLNFFIWEFKFTQRLSLEKGEENQKIFLNSTDYLYFNLISRILILQHLIFLKFNDAEHKQYEELKIFYDTTINPHGCYGCQFKKFINLVQNQF